jgi:ABC-type multidrug transport system fused ATPase/permease subunit
MNNELTDIINGLKRTIQLINPIEKRLLFFAVTTMAVTGLLTNLPAIIIGKLVDQMQSLQSFSFSQSLPYILSIFLILIVREGLIVIRKLII